MSLLDGRWLPKGAHLPFSRYCFSSWQGVTVTLPTGKPGRGVGLVTDTPTKVHVPFIVREHHLRLHGHVAHFPDADPAHQILSARESREWRRPMRRPRASWLQPVDWHLNEMGWARHLPGGWPDGGPWSSGGKWMQ